MKTKQQTTFKRDFEMRYGVSPDNGKPAQPQAAHSPLPWTLSNGAIYDATDNGNLAGGVFRSGRLVMSSVHVDPQNAKLIVASVNHAEALAEACEDMMHDLDIFYAKYREPGNKYLANLKARLAEFRRAQ